MLVLDLAEYLLEDVLDGDHACRAPELVDHDGDRVAAADEQRQQLLSRHALGHVVDLVENLSDRARIAEQALGVDVSDDVVDVVAVDRQAGKLRVDELPRGFFDRATLFDGLDVDARNHAVAHEQVRKVERVLEQPDILLVLRLLAVLGGLVEQMRQILAVERADRLVAPQRQPGHFEDADRHERRQFGDRVEKQIEEIDRQREAPVVEVRVEPDDGFRHELRREKDDGRRYERLDQVRSSVAGRDAGGMQSGLDQHAHLERVDDQRDIVAYQDRRDILSGIFCEQPRDVTEQAASLAFDLQLQLVRR